MKRIACSECGRMIGFMAGVEVHSCTMICTSCGKITKISEVEK